MAKRRNARRGLVRVVLMRTEQTRASAEFVNELRNMGASEDVIAAAGGLPVEREQKTPAGRSGSR